MNLAKLFEMQQKLDDHIMDEHPELRGQNNLDWKIIALQVELGECANEWRGFKKWSNDQEPRTCVCIDACRNCGGTGNSFGVPEEAGIGCWDCGGSGEITKNPLLEEYVDCLHFILSIGLELKTPVNSLLDKFDLVDEQLNNTTIMFHQIYACSSNLYWSIRYVGAIHVEYFELLQCFLKLGEMLGFTWQQIEEAYMSKNAVNHERQNNGY